MTTAEFNALQPGNIIILSVTVDGVTSTQKFMVEHAMTNQAGQTVSVGVIQALDLTDAPNLTLNNPNSLRMFIRGECNGKLVLMDETIQAPE